MGNDFKKQTSTISAKEALAYLLAEGFKINRVSRPKEIDEIPKAYRKDVLSARREFGEDADISNTGRSITLFGPHDPSMRIVNVHVPLFEMLRHGELEQLQKITGRVLKHHLL